MKTIDEILKYFDELYPNPVCALKYKTPYQLLVAVVLSAQCTDKRVNMVTEKLFKIAPTPDKMIKLGEEKLKDYIHPLGCFNTKAKSIISLSYDLIQKFNGVVPKTMEELTTLRGVGRKTANVVLGVAFGEQTLAVDTHVLRVSKRLRLTNEKSNPLVCEKDLLSIIPIDRQTKFHHQTIWFGREHCKAISPLCEDCKLRSVCKYKRKKQ